MSWVVLVALVLGTGLALCIALARRAERAYRHELAIQGGDPIIKYGYWDSLRTNKNLKEKENQRDGSKNE